MIDYTLLPGVNASLNGLSGCFLVIGYLAIRNGHATLHRRLMLSAFTTSTLFLISYLTYHFQVQFTPFQGQGAARIVYYAILIPHVVLAVVMVPMILVTLKRGLTGHFDKHRPIARWTLPIWLYVSVTGVLVYLMLYVWYPNG